MKVNKGGNIFVTAIFLIIIFSLFFMSFFYKSNTTTEKRNLSTFPDLKNISFIEWPSNLTDYFNDNFAFRKEIVKLYSLLQMKIIGDSGVDNVLKGKDGWLYYSSSVNNAYMPFLSDAQLDYIVNIFNSLNNQLNNIGIPLYIIIPPSKAMAYPEHLPNWVVNNHPGTDKDYIINSIQTNIPTLDLLPIINEIKTSQPDETFYFLEDTHWNFRGAYESFIEIIQFLSDNEFNISYQDTNIFWYESLNEGDLILMLDSEPTEIVNFYEIKNDISSSIQLETNYTSQFGFTSPITLVSNQGKTGRIFLLRDSFAGLLIPLFSESFEEMCYIHYYDVDLSGFISYLSELEKKPDAVIIEVADRMLVSFDNKSIDNL